MSSKSIYYPEVDSRKFSLCTFLKLQVIPHFMSSSPWVTYRKCSATVSLCSSSWPPNILCFPLKPPLAFLHCFDPSPSILWHLEIFTITYSMDFTSPFHMCPSYHFKKLMERKKPALLNLAQLSVCPLSGNWWKKK